MTTNFKNSIIFCMVFLGFWSEFSFNTYANPGEEIELQEKLERSRTHHTHADESLALLHSRLTSEQTSFCSPKRALYISTNILAGILLAQTFQLAVRSGTDVWPWGIVGGGGAVFLGSYSLISTIFYWLDLPDRKNIDLASTFIGLALGVTYNTFL